VLYCVKIDAVVWRYMGDGGRMTRFQSQRKQKNTMNLSTKQKQHLKGLAHPLKPVVMLGNNGLTEGVLAEIEQALGHHELIKVKIASEDRETKALIVEAIVRETGACNVQVIGKTLVLYRPTPERKISLPR
ncbi:ribosome assembly RNA-binding protein YhbY, partial [Alistipes putredinis]